MISLASALSLQPQCRKVLAHLEKRGSISPMEALTVYGIYRLSSVIHKLRAIGLTIHTDLRRDNERKTYARYSLKEAI